MTPIRIFFALAAAFAPGIVAAQAGGPLSIRDSFRIGSTGVLCTAQSRPLDPALRGMFDRGYAVLCRDAASSVGNLYALRVGSDDPVAGVAKRRGEDVVCEAPASAPVEGVGTVAVVACTASSSKVGYRSYSVTRGKTIYVAEGLGGYDSALQLGLRALVADRAVSGEVQVATTSAGDPSAFARIQAGTLDADSALNEAYARNNSGNFAEAAEFFETLIEREAASGQASTRASEYLVNQALQQSNLGNFAAASQLLRQVEESGATRDPVTGRLVRNYRAIHLLNQQRGVRALAELAKPVPVIGRETGADAEIEAGTITPLLADQINRENASLERLGGIDGRLRPSERAQILDGQAALLRGAALRIGGRLPEARAALKTSATLLEGVRDGRVVSTAFLRSENFAELGRIGEAQGDFIAAEAGFVESARILDINYPQSASGLAAKARLAAYLGRRGQVDRALALYGEIIAASETLPGAAATMRNQIAPYFALLIARAESDPNAVASIFAAGQILQRPGVAQTQAVLARELSGGNDEAAQLFRQSVTLSREISRTSGDLARLIAANPQPTSEVAAQITDARGQLSILQSGQTVLQSRLGAFPRYRVLAPPALTLAGLQETLRAGEGYYQLRLIGQDAYALFVTRTTARAAKLETSERQLGEMVAALRATIVTLDGGTPQTYPFDAALSHRLYTTLFGPFGDALTSITHLIFEPDGPMLQLPANLLVMEQAGVDAYAKRIAREDADQFDFTGIAWLGRDRDVTTAVSPRSFADVRAIPAAKGDKAYLGLGQNAIPTAPLASAAAPGLDCSWPLATWESPIAADELRLASSIVGAGRSQVLTDAAFSDSALSARADLDQYRVLHFATHGLVTAPRPECPARPALLTSFGEGASDGLLTFREIYDLKLDADIVVLSACDTAGMATIAATREAGITTGGNFALDGLVRAFVGAGARTVVASHWPVPDDFDATKRLIEGFFSAPPGTPMATALRQSQRAMMASPTTSHPYYWSAFAIVGDGERPVLSGAR